MSIVEASSQARAIFTLNQDLLIELQYQHFASGVAFDNCKGHLDIKSAPAREATSVRSSSSAEPALSAPSCEVAGGWMMLSRVE
jgi:hypothetical protein